MELTLTDKAYEGLRKKLASGELRAGQRIVNRTVAKELKVSQTPLREAVNRLASEGILEYVPGAGAFVRKIGIPELVELYEFREHIEPFAAALAARNISAAEVLELRGVCNGWRRIVRQLRNDKAESATAGQMAEWNDLEERFHASLLTASRNRWLVGVTKNLRLLSLAFAVQRDQPQLLTYRAAVTTWRDHLRIVLALRRRDASASERLVREHIARGKAYVLRALRNAER